VKTLLTRARIIETLRPGDGIGVFYRKPNAVQEGIRLETGGHAEHWLCVVDGFDIVEALTIGVYRSSLENYLGGDCDLIVKRARPHLSVEEKRLVVDEWVRRVGEHYGFGMIVGLAILLAIRKVLHPFSPKLAARAFQKLPNLFARPDRPTCAELWVIGLRIVRHLFLKHYADGKIYPSLLQRDRDADTVAEWPGATLARG
jgi:hypothetical protein